MVVWKNIIMFWVVLIVTFVAMYLLVILLGHNNPDVRDTALAIGGGIFGGLAFTYYNRAYPEHAP
jgi:hypothetical protein